MLRNKFLSASLLAAFATVGIWGCGTEKKETTNNTSTPLVEFNKTMTLQGKIINAVTGAPIGGADLKVYLIQGITNRTPDKLITDTADNNVGEYAFSGVPVALNESIAYKVVALNTGYQRFEGECLFDYNYGTDTGAAVDTIYNWIGNIYLYPVGTPAGDITVYVKNSVGTAISGATVLLRQNINSNTATNGTTTVTTTLPGSAIASTTLTATNSLVQSLSGTTGTDGKVTFAGTTLTLGGSYTPVVLPLTSDGQQLAATAGTAVIVGTTGAVAAQQITMTDLEPTGNLLYVVSASNSITGSVQTTGALALTFNRKIAFDSNGSTSFTATATDGTLNATSATAAISSDGYTLTLTPSFATAPTVAGTTVTFAGGASSIVIQGYTGTSYTPLSLLDINGAAISATVKMIAN